MRAVRLAAPLAVVAAGAGLLGFSAGNVKSMDQALKAVAPAERVLDGEMVTEGARPGGCRREHRDTVMRTERKQL